MAIAVDGGHVSRALDFYSTPAKYFIIGGTIPWADDSTPDTPLVTDYKLKDVVGLKKVDNTYMVIPTDETENVISYRDQNWKRVEPLVQTTIDSIVPAGSLFITVKTLGALKIGDKLRIANIYEGTIEDTDTIDGKVTITLDTAAPEEIPIDSIVIGGAKVEGSKYVYVECYLNYDEFPIVESYRQIGLCTGVSTNKDDDDVLRAAAYSSTGSDEYTSLGTLEVLDNRVPSARNLSQRELLSLIIEF